MATLMQNSLSDVGPPSGNGRVHHQQLHQPQRPIPSPPAAAAAAAAEPNLTLTNNQLQKRVRRAREKEVRESALTSALAEDPLCRRLLEVHSRFQQQFKLEWNGESSVSWRYSNQFDGKREEEGKDSIGDANGQPALKKRKLTATVVDDDDAAEAAAIISSYSSSASASSASAAASYAAFSTHQSCSRVGAIARNERGILLDHARQISANYTHHTMNDTSEFVAFTESKSTSNADSNSDSRSTISTSEFFRLVGPYQELQRDRDRDRDRSIPTSLRTMRQSPSPYPTGVWRNPDDQDLQVTINEQRFVLPPNSLAIASQLSTASTQLRKFRPETGFNLIIIDPPWESKSVRRSNCYSCIRNEELFQLPIRELLPSPSTPTSTSTSNFSLAYVAVWVTNNPHHTQFVLQELFPRWQLHHVATWHWLKICDDGRMVLPLHPASDRNHRKPYEVLLIGSNAAEKSETIITHSTTHTPAAPPMSSSFLIVDSSSNSNSVNSNPRVTVAPVPLQLPSEYIIISVPGENQHSRKPQLRDLFQPYLPRPVIGLELFARNLVRDFTSWGNEPLRFQQLRQQSGSR